MYRAIIVTAIVTCLSGCLGTNRKVEITQDASGISDINTSVWWRSRYTATTPRDKNPWLTFVPVVVDKDAADAVYFESNVIKWPKQMPPLAETGTVKMRILLRKADLERLLRKLQRRSSDGKPKGEVY